MPKQLTAGAAETLLVDLASARSRLEGETNDPLAVELRRILEDAINKIEALLRDSEAGTNWDHLKLKAKDTLVILGEKIRTDFNAFTQGLKIDEWGENPEVDLPKVRQFALRLLKLVSDQWGINPNLVRGGLSALDLVYKELNSGSPIPSEDEQKILAAKRALIKAWDQNPEKIKKNPNGYFQVEGHPEVKFFCIGAGKDFYTFPNEIKAFKEGSEYCVMVRVPEERDTSGVISHGFIRRKILEMKRNGRLPPEDEELAVQIMKIMGGHLAGNSTDRSRNLSNYLIQVLNALGQAHKGNPRNKLDCLSREIEGYLSSRYNYQIVWGLTPDYLSRLKSQSRSALIQALPEGAASHNVVCTLQPYITHGKNLIQVPTVAILSIEK